MASLKQSAAIGHDPRLHTGAPLLSLLPPPFLRFAGKGVVQRRWQSRMRAWSGRRAVSGRDSLIGVRSGLNASRRLLS